MDKSGITPADILRRAREIITPPERWMKYDYYSRGAYCVLGAVAEATDQLGVKRADRRLGLALDALNAAVPPVYNGYLTQWNDHTDRTHEEVLRAFDEAIGGK